MTVVARAIDRAMEATVVGSFTRAGPMVRRRLFDWTDRRDLPRLDGRSIVVTGATSGLGEAMAHDLAALGATLWLVARDETKAAALRRTLRYSTGNADVHVAIADLASLEQVEAAAETIAEAGPVHGVMHNAGALFADYGQTVDGHERTVQLHVLAPFLLTERLLSSLAAAGTAARPGRVVWMASGGMYTQRLDLDRLVMPPNDFDGTVAYARAKRAQVALVGEWSRRLPPEVAMHAMHPGWADTPGVVDALPTFHRVLGPALRTPAQGGDTGVWLLATDDALGSGALWLDRRRRPRHKVPWTRRRDERDEAMALFEWCRRHTQ